MKTVFTLILIGTFSFSFGQTKTTQSVDDQYDGLTLYFYRNTLRMLNQKEDKDFDELIKDIEKMRFLMIDKANSKFDKEDYKKLLAGYQGEEYEEMMTGRYDGRNFDVYLKEKNGDVKGTVILANDSTSLIILDILGKIALNKAPDLFKAIDGSTDIGKKIQSFMGKDEDKEKDGKHPDDKNPSKN
jgi:Domain of unknown function (DUF4252)